MQSLKIIMTWDAATKLITAEAHMNGVIPTLPERVIVGLGSQPEGRPLENGDFTAMKRVLALSLQEAIAEANNFADAERNLAQARELLGLPADYGKKWMAFVKTSGMPAYWFASVEVADAFMADAFNAANYTLEEGVPLANLPEWTVPPVIIHIGEEYKGGADPGGEFDPDPWVATWRFSSEGDAAIWEAEDPDNRRLGTTTAPVDLPLWTPPQPQVWVGYVGAVITVGLQEREMAMVGEPTWWFSTQDQVERWVLEDPTRRTWKREVAPANLPRWPSDYKEREWVGYENLAVNGVASWTAVWWFGAKTVGDDWVGLMPGARMVKLAFVPEGVQRFEPQQ